jgi:hypothetical protein
MESPWPFAREISVHQQVMAGPRLRPLITSTCGETLSESFLRMNSAIEGGCVCGGLRYRLDAAPTQTNDCHCIDCRRSSGAPFVTWGSVDRDKLTILAGQIRKIPHAQRVRSFASCCGTQLFFEEAPDAETIDVTIASLDDPLPFPPAMSIWTEDRLPWVVLDESRAVYTRSSRDG